MFQNAIYYPTIDIHNSGWLRSAVLFWENIETIVPTSIENPYQENDTSILYNEGVLSPIRCDIYPDIIELAGNEMINNFQGSSINKIRGIDGQLRLHANKLSSLMRSELLHRCRSMQESQTGEPSIGSTDYSTNIDDWLEVSPLFANTYMSILATFLSKKLNCETITDKYMFAGAHVQSMIDQVNEKNKPRNNSGGLFSVILENTKIDPDTPIQKLVNFRRNNRELIIGLERQVQRLSASLVECEDSRDFENRANKIYRTEIEHGISNLRRELTNSSLKWTADGFIKAATISIPSAGISAWQGWSTGLALGATAAVSLAGFGLKSHVDRRQIKANSPYTYLMSIDEKFSPSLWGG